MSFLSNTSLLSSSGIARSYAALNPSAKPTNMTLSNGNLTFQNSLGGSYGFITGTIGKSSGKWYWEVTANSFNPNPSSSVSLVGISSVIPPLNNSNTGYWLGYTSGTASIRPNAYNDAYWYNFGSFLTPGTLTTDYTTGSVISCALDLTSLTFEIFLDGVSIDTSPISIPAGTYYPAIAMDMAGCNGTVNFGQNAWSTHATVTTTRNNLFAAGFNQGVYL